MFLFLKSIYYLSKTGRRLLGWTGSRLSHSACLSTRGADTRKTRHAQRKINLAQCLPVSRKRPPLECRMVKFIEKFILYERRSFWVCRLLIFEKFQVYQKYWARWRNTRIRSQRDSRLETRLYWQRLSSNIGYNTKSNTF